MITYILTKAAIISWFLYTRANNFMPSLREGFVKKRKQEMITSIAPRDAMLSSVDSSIFTQTALTGEKQTMKRNKKKWSLTFWQELPWSVDPSLSPEQFGLPHWERIWSKRKEQEVITYIMPRASIAETKGLKLWNLWKLCNVLM